MITLPDVYDAYRYHPEFLGLEIVDVSQRGALDGTLLHIAARMERLDHIRTLVAAGAALDAAGDLGNTPLHEAAMSGRARSVALLLALGANACISNDFGQTALRVAELGNHKEVVEIIRAAIS